MTRSVRPFETARHGFGTRGAAGALGLGGSGPRERAGGMGFCFVGIIAYQVSGRRQRRVTKRGKLGSL